MKLSALFCEGENLNLILQEKYLDEISGLISIKELYLKKDLWDFCPININVTQCEAMYIGYQMKKHAELLAQGFKQKMFNPKTNVILKDLEDQYHTSIALEELVKQVKIEQDLMTFDFKDIGEENLRFILPVLNPYKYFLNATRTTALMTVEELKPETTDFVNPNLIEIVHEKNFGNMVFELVNEKNKYDKLFYNVTDDIIISQLFNFLISESYSHTEDFVIANRLYRVIKFELLNAYWQYTAQISSS